MITNFFNRRFFSWCALICFASLFYTTTLFASPVYWPTNGWRSSTPEEQGMGSEKLIEMMEKVRDRNYAIDSITIIRNGFLVMDAYAYPLQKNSKHLLYSVTKSVTSTLIGIALDKGYIKSVKQPILDFFPGSSIADADERKRSITLEHLLNMASGMDTQDSYLYGWVGLGKMMEGEDWTQYVLDRPMIHAPGTTFEYSNCVSHLLSAILQKTTGMSALAFAQKHLFAPLGITDVKWPSNRQGVNTGWGNMMLTPHDMAKIGLLYLNKGVWENKRVISAAWVEAATQKHIPATLFDGYGYQWWVSSEGFYMAVGYLGQFIFVVPEKNLVVVFTGNNLKKSAFYIPIALLRQYIIPAADSSQPLAARPMEKERLNSLLKNLAKAPAKGFIWDSEEKGTVKKGDFVRTASPAFRFRGLEMGVRHPTNFPSQVMRMKTLEGNTITASISDIPTDTKLEDVGPRIFAPVLKNYGSEIQVLFNREIVLEDGTVAYRTDINWKWQSSFALRTLLVSAFQGGKWVYLAYTLGTAYDDLLAEGLNEGGALVESLTFR